MALRRTVCASFVLMIATLTPSSCSDTEDAQVPVEEVKTTYPVTIVDHDKDVNPAPEYDAGLRFYGS